MLAQVAEAVRRPDEIRWVVRRAENGKPYMVRRYIRAELGNVVTVDFGARTWTFDAGPADTFSAAARSEGSRVWVAQAA